MTSECGRFANNLKWIKQVAISNWILGFFAIPGNKNDKISAFLLLSLPVLFLTLSLVIPVCNILISSVRDSTLSELMPEFSNDMIRWDGKGLPDESVVKVFIEELMAARVDRTHGRIARRVNAQIPGMRSMVLDTSFKLGQTASTNSVVISDNLKFLGSIDSRWKERQYWVAFKQAAPKWTTRHLLRLLDLKRDIDGNIVRVEERVRLFVRVFFRTLWICSCVTLICLCLAYPIAFRLAGLPSKYGNLVVLFLLLPLWTSMLVKSCGWLVSLQNEGVINDLGIILGFWNEPFEMARHRRGTFIAMVHILLPFMAFPLYSVMRGIDPQHMKAALIMGASPLKAFFRVYLPQTVPGIGAGALLVFILALGLYVPPALVGGPADQMLSYFVAANVNGGFAGAISLQLLCIVGVIILLYQRYIGIGRLWTD